MTTILKIGLVSMPIMCINLYNNRYTNSPIHLFSNCCRERIKNKRICSNCNKELLYSDLLRGLDKDTILTEEQLDTLKNFTDNQVIEVLGIKSLTNDFLFNLMPYIVKSQVILGSIRKGYKKSNLITFESFKTALNELNKYCIVRKVDRGLEHIGIVFNFKSDLMFLEVPFNHLYNKDEIDRLKEQVGLQAKNLNLNAYSLQAREFIENFKLKADIDKIKEEKKQLLKVFISELQNPKSKVFISKPQQEKEELNPFLSCNNQNKRGVKKSEKQYTT